MQVTPRRPPGGAHSGDDLAHFHGVTRPDGDSLQVVVGGDETVSVVNFHAVAPAPRVPASRPDHAGVGGIHPGAAGRGEILAEVKVPSPPRDGTDPEPEGRARREYLKGRHQGAFRRAPQLGGSHVQRCFSVPRDRPDNGAAEGDQRPAVRQDRGTQGTCTHLAGSGSRYGAAGLERRDGGQSQRQGSRNDSGAGGKCAHRRRAGAWRLFVPAGTPMISHSLTPGWPVRPQSGRTFHPMGPQSRRSVNPISVARGLIVDLRESPSAG
jgi:hypothetical protein